MIQAESSTAHPSNIWSEKDQVAHPEVHSWQTELLRKQSKETPLYPKFRMMVEFQHQGLKEWEILALSREPPPYPGCYSPWKQRASAGGRRNSSKDNAACLNTGHQPQDEDGNCTAKNQRIRDLEGAIKTI